MRENRENSENISKLPEMIKDKEQYRKIIQAAVAKWVRRFQENEIRADTVEDLRTLIQIDLELQRSIIFDEKRMHTDSDIGR